MSPGQNQVPFEQVLAGLEPGSGSPGWPGDPKCGAALAAGSAEPSTGTGLLQRGLGWMWPTGVMSAELLSVGCWTQLRDRWHGKSPLQGWEITRGCPQAPWDVKRDDVTASFCLDLLVCPVQRECDQQPRVWVAPPWLLGGGVHVGVPSVCRSGVQVTVTASFSLGLARDLLGIAGSPCPCVLEKRHRCWAGQADSLRRGSLHHPALEPWAGAAAVTATSPQRVPRAGGARSHGPGRLTLPVPCR